LARPLLTTKRLGSFSKLAIRAFVMMIYAESAILLCAMLQ
jgi:hypothetical protein